MLLYWLSDFALGMYLVDMHLASILTEATAGHTLAATRMHLRTDTSWVMSGRARTGLHGFPYWSTAHLGIWVSRFRFLPVSLSSYLSLSFSKSLSCPITIFPMLHLFFSYSVSSLLSSTFSLLLLSLFNQISPHRSGRTSNARNTRRQGYPLSLDFRRAWWW